MAEGQVKIVRIYVQLELHYEPIKIAWIYVQQDLYEGHINILLEYFRYVAIEQIELYVYMFNKICTRATIIASQYQSECTLYKTLTDTIRNNYSARFQK